MKENNEPRRGQAGVDLYQEIEVLLRKNPWAWQSIGAITGLAGGVLAPLIGATLDVITWFVISEKINPHLNVLSSILCALTIPLLALGAHCLDLLEAKTSRLPLSAETPTTHAASASPNTYAINVNGKRRLPKTGTLAVLILLLALPSQSNAQHAILNVPTTDALPSCKVSAEPGVSAKPDDLEAKPSPSPFPYESELSQGAKPAPFNKMFPRAKYTGSVFGPLSSFRDSDPVRSLRRILGDSAAAQEVTSEEQQQLKPKWQYGGFVDLGYLLDFNHPANRLFRSRGTAFHVDRLYLNMAGAYARKKPTEQSRWGVELTIQAGKDTEVFGFSATAPNIGGYKFLRHLGPTNVSYIAPVGKGLTLQAGIFSSLIGYDSLYARDNFNYTRPWGADFTPYFMMGVNASYPFSEKLTGTFFLINGYWHLARANNVPGSGGQLAYKVNPRVTVKETVLFGPHQSNTSFKFWRFLSDTIVERKTDRVTFAFEYTASWEHVNAPGRPRALMMSSQFPVRWILNDRWNVTVRPEVFWDRDGRWTLARKTVKAVTTTLEYRRPYKWPNTIFRLEYRFDDSRGREGGFFRGREVSPGVIGLTPSQHLLVFALMFTFDSPAPR